MSDNDVAIAKMVTRKAHLDKIVSEIEGELQAGYKHFLDRREAITFYLMEKLVDARIEIEKREQQ